jgi:hypothetical protein
MEFSTSRTGGPTPGDLRRVLDEIIADRRFELQQSVSALDMAEHLLAQAAAGERDISRLKASAFSKLIVAQGRDAA